MVMGLLRLLAAAAAALSLVASAAPLHYSFAAAPAPGAVSVRWPADGAAARFDAATGYGFVERTGALPPRVVHVSTLRSVDAGATLTETAVDAEGEHANRFGLAFRIQAPPGAYAVHVRTTTGADKATVSISGLQTSRLLSTAFWDAASLLPHRNRMTVQGRDWHYRHVNGRGFIDIEVEPRRAGEAVGLEEVRLTPLPPAPRPAGERPTLFTLGDSTMKSYTFEEAPMSGWGQVLPRLFDAEQVRLQNYAMGGRSWRSAYAEGRLNDLLLAGRVGDVVLIQFGHNDESADETLRWGRGGSEAMVEALVREVYLPALRARGLRPVLVTPMARVPGALKAGEVYADSFQTRRFPALLRRLGAELGVPVVDLNARSVAYYNQAGPAAITAMVMSIEAGETPGKTNTGSYANGHPADKIDGTHFKEALSKQYARLVATELARLAQGGDATAADVVGWLRPDVRAALAAGDGTAVYPEIARDIVDGDGAYYRNQIEKLLQLGVLSTDGERRFHSEQPMGAAGFATALARLLRLPPGAVDAGSAPLTRERMAVLLLQAYEARFSSRPAYMTDYNGATVVPGAPGYDPNLDGGDRGAMYYPLRPWAGLVDTADVEPALRARVQQAYELGLIRSEQGIARGRMVNGRALEPRQTVSRAKAAKALYFMWVLAQPPKAENQQASP
ncbi:GDSL-type esterase/lipase family protein [Roseateles sp. DC23W]|uniref:GDSL-type esterase/lipase family protein n=1 Tax=Pelomonas dachongensis TaxID=3299029 RepID=A0ABW7ER24_9BURK